MFPIFPTPAASADASSASRHPKDTLFTYYHCVRKSRYDESYKCKRHEDPLEIPYQPDKYFETFIIPVRHWIPEFYHKTYIEKSIREYREKFMKVEINNSDK